eukprot:TRINITY_DN68954_c0_g1_i1.p2 TRINITY_DN68954_c0_g1~~TRINITY_DN68954_c0_g1_i1.p2  ORF type:complete len:129 (+),score=20.17 TRINITY_DN68954_c0_g1_i1:57-389(+)
MPGASSRMASRAGAAAASTVARVRSATQTRMRAAAGQLRADLRATSWRQVANEFAPKRLWADFRRLSLHTQAITAVTCYGVTATLALYGYLRYSQAQRRNQMAEVYRSFN